MQRENKTASFIADMRAEITATLSEADIRVFDICAQLEELQNKAEDEILDDGVLIGDLESSLFTEPPTEFQDDPLTTGLMQIAYRDLPKGVEVKHEDLRAACKQLAEALKLIDKHKKPSELKNKSVSGEAKDDFLKALKLANQVVEKNPYFIQALVAEAEACYQSGQFGQLKGIIDKLLSIESKKKYGYAYRGLAIYHSAKEKVHYATARKAFFEGIKCEVYSGIYTPHLIVRISQCIYHCERVSSDYPELDEEKAQLKIAELMPRIVEDRIKKQYDSVFNLFSQVVIYAPHEMEYRYMRADIALKLKNPNFEEIINDLHFIIWHCQRPELYDKNLDIIGRCQKLIGEVQLRYGMTMPFKIVIPKSELKHQPSQIAAPQKSESKRQLTSETTPETNPGLYLAQAQTEFKLLNPDYDSVVALCEKAFGEPSAYIEALNLCAKAHLKKGNVDQARKHFLELIKRDIDFYLKQKGESLGVNRVELLRDFIECEKLLHPHIDFAVEIKQGPHGKIDPRKDLFAQSRSLINSGKYAEAHDVILKIVFMTLTPRGAETTFQSICLNFNSQTFLDLAILQKKLGNPKIQVDYMLVTNWITQCGFHDKKMEDYSAVKSEWQNSLVLLAYGENKDSEGCLDRIMNFLMLRIAEKKVFERKEEKLKNRDQQRKDKKKARQVETDVHHLIKETIDQQRYAITELLDLDRLINAKASVLEQLIDDLKKAYEIEKRHYKLYGIHSPEPTHSVDKAAASSVAPPAKSGEDPTRGKKGKRNKHKGKLKPVITAKTKPKAKPAPKENPKPESEEVSRATFVPMSDSARREQAYNANREERTRASETKSEQKRKAFEAQAKANLEEQQEQKKRAEREARMEREAVQAREAREAAIISEKAREAIERDTKMRNEVEKVRLALEEYEQKMCERKAQEEREQKEREQKEREQKEREQKEREQKAQEDRRAREAEQALARQADEKKASAATSAKVLLALRLLAAARSRPTPPAPKPVISPAEMEFKRFIKPGFKIFLPPIVSEAMQFLLQNGIYTLLGGGEVCGPTLARCGALPSNFIKLRFDFDCYKDKPTAEIHEKLRAFLDSWCEQHGKPKPLVTVDLKVGFLKFVFPDDKFELSFYTKPMINISLSQAARNCDFTINTGFCNSLGESSFPCPGIWEDIERKRLRVPKQQKAPGDTRTHAQISFTNDPPRILRGIGFCTKYQFHFGFHEAQAAKELGGNLLTMPQGIGIVNHNLEKLFVNGRSADNFEKLWELEIFQKLFPKDLVDLINKDKNDFVNLLNFIDLQSRLTLVQFYAYLTLFTIEKTLFTTEKSFTKLLQTDEDVRDTFILKTMWAHFQADEKSLYANIFPEKEYTYEKRLIECIHNWMEYKSAAPEHKGQSSPKFYQMAFTPAQTGPKLSPPLAPRLKSIATP